MSVCSQCALTLRLESLAWQALTLKLTPSLYEEVMSQLTRRSVVPIPLLNDVGDDANARHFKNSAFWALKYVRYARRERVLAKGTKSEGLYFLTNGEVAAVSSTSHHHAAGSAPPSSTDGWHELFQLRTTGSFFGEQCLLEPAQSVYLDYHATRRCEFFCLSKRELLRLCAEHLSAEQRCALAQTVLASVVRKARLRLWSMRMNAMWGVGQLHLHRQDDERRSAAAREAAEAAGTTPDTHADARPRAESPTGESAASVTPGMSLWARARLLARGHILSEAAANAIEMR